MFTNLGESPADALSIFTPPRASNPLQGTGEWFSQRIGHLTGSRMRSAKKRLKNGNDSAERRDLIIESVAERITDQIVPKYVNAAMEHGIQEESNAKAEYTRRTKREIKDVGFIRHPLIEYFGASPDGFVQDGLIEIKCPTTKTHLIWIHDGDIPSEHIDQMTVQCAVTMRPWCDFVSYDPRVPEAQQLFTRRFYPTEKQIEDIENEAKIFLEEVEAYFDVITRREMVL